MNYLKFALIFIFLVKYSVNQAQNLEAYTIYNSKGKKVSYKDVLEKVKKSDILLFGEYHNNAIAHWLQLEISKEAIASRSVIFGAEMFESDNQFAVNQYIEDKINEKQLDSLARLWNNFSTDYKPLLDLAKTHNLSFIATNVPRKYASLVSKGGFEKLDSLKDNEKNWIATLPIEYDSDLSQYVKMIEEMGGNENFPKAQAIKDATMAHFILQNYITGSLFIHFNGAYHSDFYQGILWYLKRSQAFLKYCTITTVTQSDIQILEKQYIGSADFILCVDEDVTTTY